MSHTPIQPARRLAVAGAILVLCLLAVPAHAADSDAPPGAPASWLPNEQWVNEHWLPYDEQDLLDALGADHGLLMRWLARDQRPLAELARARGWAPRRLARHLVAPWSKTVAPRRVRLLRSRAMRTLTQHHLAQHMLGHTFHVVTLTQAAPYTLGVDARDVVRLRSAGQSRQAIAASRGIGAAEVTRRVMRVLRRSARRGMRAHAMSTEQARHWLHVQRTALPRSGWLVGHPPVAGAATLCRIG